MYDEKKVTLSHKQATKGKLFAMAMAHPIASKLASPSHSPTKESNFYIRT